MKPEHKKISTQNVTHMNSTCTCTHTHTHTRARAHTGQLKLPLTGHSKRKHDGTTLSEMRPHANGKHGSGIDMHYKPKQKILTERRTEDIR